MKKLSFLALAAGCYMLAAGQTHPKAMPMQAMEKDTGVVHYPAEKHLKNVCQLTNGGENAEAYWSFSSAFLTFQYHNRKNAGTCDQIFFGNAAVIMQSDSIKRTTGNNNPLPAFEYSPVSTGKGRTTCSYFLPGDSLILYATTGLSADTCPADPPYVHGKYLWAIYPEYEIVIADLNGNIRKRLTHNNYYDAEAVVSPKGDKILFTSDRSGDLELYTMDLDGGNVKQITNQLGYDGGAFFSPDGTQIIWRASRFDADSERVEYQRYMKQHLVSPMKMELFIANADGSNRRQLTNLGGANWAPFFHPSGKKVLFSSNYVTRAIPFNIYMINTDGTGLEQITSDKVFDSFPMFSPNGKRLAWCSNRNNGGTRETNIFVADWVE